MFQRSCSSEPERGGDERDRTDDPLLAKQVLSQLSYTPVSQVVLSHLRSRTSKIKQRLLQNPLTLDFATSLSLLSIERR